MSKIKHLYLDMDGVLVDFTQGCISLFGKPFDEADKSECWKKISKHETFWIDLLPLPEADAFVHMLSVLGLKHDFTVRVLSGTPSSKTFECELQKMQCIKKHFHVIHPSRVHLCKSKSKQMYACNHSVLIDDRPENIQRWNDAGGIGVYHKEGDNYENTLKTILELLGEAY